MAALARTAGTYNATPRTTKFVRDVTIDADSGVITVTYAGNSGNGVPTALDNATVLYTPLVTTASGTFQPIADGVTGAIDWACTCATNLTPTRRGMPATTGTLPAQYAPAECR